MNLFFPFPPAKKERYQKAIAEMDAYWGLKSGWEKRMMPCLVLTRLNNEIVATSDSLASKRSLRKLTINALLQNIDISTLFGAAYPPVIDETGYAGEFLLTEWSDIPSLRAALRQSGFDIKEGRRNIDMFVLTETR